MNENGKLQKPAFAVAKCLELLHWIGAASMAALVFSTAARLILGPEMAELSMDLDSLIMGLFVLCLTGVFSYGMELQRDVDGLV